MTACTFNHSTGLHQVSSTQSFGPLVWLKNTCGVVYMLVLCTVWGGWIRHWRIRRTELDPCGAVLSVRSPCLHIWMRLMQMPLRLLKRDWKTPLVNLYTRWLQNQANWITDLSLLACFFTAMHGFPRKTWEAQPCGCDRSCLQRAPHHPKQVTGCVT